MHMYQKYTDEKLAELVKSSKSIAQVVRLLGLKLAGGTYSHLSKRIKKANIDISHFTGQAHNKGNTNKKLKHTDILINDANKEYRTKTHLLTRALLDCGVVYECDNCKVSNWCNKPMVLHVDHIDGNWTNNVKNNLRFLCPNCHSQTSSFCRKKK